MKVIFNLNRIFNLSPHENIRTIALITSHYLSYSIIYTHDGNPSDCRRLSTQPHVKHSKTGLH